MGFCSNFPTNSAQDGRRDRKLLKTSAVLKVYKSMTKSCWREKAVDIFFEQGFLGVHSDRREASKATKKHRTQRVGWHVDTKKAPFQIKAQNKKLFWLALPHTAGANEREVFKYKVCSLIFLLWISQWGGFLWIEWFALWKKYLNQFCILFTLLSRRVERFAGGRRCPLKIEIKWNWKAAYEAISFEFTQKRKGRSSAAFNHPFHIYSEQSTKNPFMKNFR